MNDLAQRSPQESTARQNFLLGGDEMGSRLREHDWLATPLGSFETWPEALRTLVSVLLAAKQPMFVAWGSERTLLYNDAYAEILAAKHPAALGQRFLDVWSEIRDDLVPIVERAFAGEPVHMDDITLVMERRGYPEETHFAFSYTPVRDPAGTVAGFFCACVETTEQVLAERSRQEAEAALRAERDRAQGVLDNMGDAFALLDGAFRIIDMNVAAMRLETRPREEIVGRTHWEAHPDASPELGTLFRRAMSDRVPVALEHRYVWPDGRETWIDMHAYPVADGLAVFYRDVSERKQAEAAVAESEARFRNMADQAPVMMWVTDPSGACTYLNRRWYEFTGQEDGAGEGHGWLDAVHHEDRGVAEQAFMSANAARRDYRVEFRVRRADGMYRWAIDAAATRFGPDGAYLGYVGSIIDIDERREAELTLQATTARAEALVAEQAAILGQLAEGVIVADRAGRITFVNEAAIRIHGVARLDVEPDQYSETYSLLTLEGEPYPSHELPLARAVLNGETVPDARWRIRRPVGSEVLAVGSARPVLAASGDKIGAVLTLRDDTERAAAEAALRASEARLSFLDRLGAETAPLADADTVLATTTRLLGEHMNLSICAYADMDDDQDGFTIRGDWAAPGLRSIVGHYSLATFGKLAVKNLSAGLPLVVNDNLRELAPEEAATFQGIGITATICMPLVKEGRLTALMAIHDKAPRVWNDAELSLLREVTARSWAHVERVGVLAELRGSEAELRALNADLERQVIARALARGRTWQISPDILGVINGDGYFEASNPTWQAMLGWSEAEVARTVFFDFIHPDDLPRTQAAWRDVVDRGLPALRFENRYRCKEGGWRWLSWVAVPDDGKVYCSARDITADKEREAELAARTAERDRMWETSPDLMLVLDFKGVFRRVNPAWTTILGYVPEELVGRHVNEFVVADDHRDTTDAYEHAAVGGRPTIQNRYRHKDGSLRWISWVAAPAGDMTYATGRDVTEEKKQQVELEAAQEALRQSQKMEAVGQLTGGIAHDFNNMLAVVVGSLDLLGRRLGTGDARAKRYVDAATEGARRAALLTQRLLAFSRQQPLRPAAIDVNKLVTGMSDLLRGSLTSDIRFETVLAGGGWRTHADPNQLENVLLNLAVNARDAMPEGGRLTIETQNTHLDARYAAAHLGVPAGQYVLIAVTDTGSGMPEGVIAKAFDPFFTTKAVGKGTGLGLSQVYGFVKQSGGHVTIYSEPGQGTTVKVYLPRLIGPEHDGAEGAASTELPLGEAQEVILVVEDEPTVRQFSVDALTELGYRVLEADGAATALRLLEAHPEIELMFTDVVMPDVNGRKLADEARQRRPDLRVLFTTGYTRNAIVHNGVLDPGVELIGKPFTIEELAAKLRDVLDAPAAAAG